MHLLWQKAPLLADKANINHFEIMLGTIVTEMKFKKLNEHIIIQTERSFC